jgi:hypothetical protein
MRLYTREYEDELKPCQNGAKSEKLAHATQCMPASTFYRALPVRCFDPHRLARFILVNLVHNKPCQTVLVSISTKIM